MSAWSRVSVTSHVMLGYCLPLCALRWQISHHHFRFTASPYCVRCDLQCCAADDVGHALLVCTFFVVLLTVLFNGGASPWMMRVLALRAEDEDRQACRPCSACWNAGRRT